MNEEHFQVATIGFVSGTAAIQHYLVHPLNFSRRVPNSLHAAGIPT